MFYYRESMNMLGASKAVMLKKKSFITLCRTKNEKYHQLLNNYTLYYVPYNVICLISL